MPHFSITKDGIDPALARLPKYAIGQRMRIVKADVPAKAAPETKKILQKALGRVLAIKDIWFWESGRPETPYHITYTFHVGHLNGAPNRRAFLETIDMDDDELEPVARRSGRNRIAPQPMLSGGQT